ncbi:hypothetical protein EV356DRAFT_53788 [Viridothelium virens]|uniref:F-box domain-containing protein n=1 Tax=Viridothelium virens TaxID=1048519 RepID=A0A6A6HFY1_VIRVR|nr:hypothetical protein EV356DRAFT_53788 [Viridothelium virens]
MMSFLDLPPELRLEVYTYFLDADRFLLNARSSLVDSIHSLRFSCRTINDEVKAELRKHTRFHIVESAQHESLYHRSIEFQCGTKRLLVPFGQITDLMLTIHWTTFREAAPDLKFQFLLKEMQRLKTLSIEFWFAKAMEGETTQKLLIGAKNSVMTVQQKCMVVRMIKRGFVTTLAAAIRAAPPGCLVKIGYTHDDLPFEPGKLECLVRDDLLKEKGAFFRIDSNLMQEVWGDFSHLVWDLL